MSQSAGSKRSARPSTRTPKSARPLGSSLHRVRGNSAGGLPSIQRCRSWWAISSGEILINQDPQLLQSALRHLVLLRENGVSQRGAAFARSLGGHRGHSSSHDSAGVLGVLREIAEDVGYRDGVVIFVPAIV